MLLLQDGVDVDAADGAGGATPLFLAAKARSVEAVTALLEAGANRQAKCFGKTVGEHIKEKMPGFDADAVKVKVANSSCSSSSSVRRMVDLLSLRRDLADKYRGEFVRLLTEVEADALNRGGVFGGGYTLLQVLSDRGFSDCVAALLDKRGGEVDVDGTTDAAPMTPMLMAAARGDADTMKVLLERGASLGAVNRDSGDNVLHYLLKAGGGKEADKCKRCVEYLLGEKKLAKGVRAIINKRDVLRNTALHYATQFWPQETVRKLLELGANIGMKNHWDEIPISNIPPQTMEDFLDEFCLRGRGDVNHENFELTFNYSFLAPPIEDLPEENREGINTVDPENLKLTTGGEGPKVALPETQSLWHMGQSKQHRHLLKHPVVTSFMYLKWGRIRKDFNRNLRFYLLFVYMLTWFIFEKYGGKGIKTTTEFPDENTTTIPFFHAMFGILSIIFLIFILRDWFMDIKEKMKAEKIKEVQEAETYSSGKMFCMVLVTNWVEAIFLSFVLIILIGGRHMEVLWISLLILTCLLIAREFFQVAVSLKRYILSPENWLEVTVIILILILLFHPEEGSEDMKRHLAAVAIVLSWAELITLVGKHPKLTTYNVYVVMFYTVMGTFFFFLLWYTFFIIAFGLGFYIMLHKDAPTDDPPSDDDYIFFNSPWLALVKTSTMFVGELEFGDIPINLDSKMTPLSYIFLLAFVFLIVVVLMNLLNGLAVSDTGVIKEKAEIVSYISRVDTISYTESILLGDPFNFLSNWPALKWLKNIPSGSFCSHLYQKRALKSVFHRLVGATGILLFYNVLPTKKLTLKPNLKRRECNFCHVSDCDFDCGSTILFKIF